MPDEGFLREPVRVIMHLPGGFLKVVLERTIGSGLAHGGVEWDIPSSKVPVDLRPIGSRFEVIYWTDDESGNTGVNKQFKIEVVRT